MGIVVSIDGARVDPDARHISVFDRGFLFGDGVFEALRTYGGRRCFALDEHLERLAWSAARVGIVLPFELDVLAREIDGCIAEAQNEESYLRVVVTRGIGPIALDPATAQHPTRVVIVMPLKGIAKELYAEGVGLAVVTESRPIVSGPGAGAKTCNYVPNLLALREALSRGAHEALFVTADGRVTEGATSNVFALSEGRLATSPLSEGILPGITRRHVMDVARELSLEVVEAPLRLTALLEADEVFLSSSIREVLPVVRIDERSIGDGKPGAMTQRIHAMYVERARATR